MKKSIKILLIICIILLILILTHIFRCYIIVNKIKDNGTEYLNSLNNYKVISTGKIEGDEEEKTEYYFKDKICVIKDNNRIFWENKNTNEKICLDLDTNEYIDAIEINSPVISIGGEWYNNIFNFISKKDNYYIFTYIRFGSVSKLYYNINTGVMEKHEGNLNGMKYISTYKIEKDCVTEQDITKPEM